MILPSLVEANEVADCTSDHLIIIDLRSPDDYLKGHIPNAINIPPAALSTGEKPAPGKLPSIDQLTSLMQSIGLTADKHVVAYDDAGGTWAGRMIWTLDVIGHYQSSLLNGGIAAWVAAELPLETKTNTANAPRMEFQLDNSLIADYEEIFQHLNDDSYAVWDARGADEYNGSKVLAAKGGHIPGAIHLEWTELTDSLQYHKLKPSKTLQTLLNDKGLTSDKTIATHCQTHRRSGLTWFVAKKLLNYPNIKAYPGSWSEWGNMPESPVET